MMPADTDVPCADPGALWLVDAAFDSADARREMRRSLCPRCPVGSACLAEAMRSGEHGVWGGTIRLERSRHGAPAAAKANLIGIHAAGPVAS